MVRKSLLASGAIAVAGLASLGMHPACAAVMTVSTDISVGGFVLTDSGYEFSVPTFDQSLGTLTDATVRFGGMLRPGYLGIGNLPQPTPDTITLTPYLDINPGQLTGTFAPEIVPVTGVHNDAIGVWEPFDLKKSLPISDFVGSPGEPADNSPAQFFLRGYSLTNAFNFASSDSLDDLTVGGVFAIDYTYTPAATTAVPEPGSFGLLLAGLLGLGGIGFVTKRSKTV